MTSLLPVDTTGLKSIDALNPDLIGVSSLRQSGPAGVNVVYPSASSSSSQQSILRQSSVLNSSTGNGLAAARNNVVPTPAPGQMHMVDGKLTFVAAAYGSNTQAKTDRNIGWVILWTVILFVIFWLIVWAIIWIAKPDWAMVQDDDCNPTCCLNNCVAAGAAFFIVLIIFVIVGLIGAASRYAC